MLQITIKIDGMMCGMCEAHINDAIRRAFPIKKVTASHSKGEAVLLSEHDIPDPELRTAIEQTGYKVLSIEKHPYEKKGTVLRISEIESGGQVPSSIKYANKKKAEVFFR